MTPRPSESISVRNTCREDFPGIVALSTETHTCSAPWRIDQLESHLTLFPECQFVAIQPQT